MKEISKSAFVFNFNTISGVFVIFNFLGRALTYSELWIYNTIYMYTYITIFITLYL